MKPILYSYYRSSCSYRVRIALNIKEIDYDYRSVHLVKEGGEQFKPEYVELNPKSEVPLLIHEGVEISQSMAIIDYLDRSFEGINLFPKKDHKRAKCIELCEIINSGIQPLQNLKVLKEIVSRFKLDEAEKKQWGQFWIEEGFHALEKNLAKTAKTFSLGDKVSAVDCFLVPQVYNANRFGIDMDRFPTIKKVNEHCLSMKEFIDAAPEQQEDAV